MAGTGHDLADAGRTPSAPVRSLGCADAQITKRSQLSSSIETSVGVRKKR
jgi:hypothetical protein